MVTLVLAVVAVATAVYKAPGAAFVDIALSQYGSPRL
jgi:hypothetical protein